MSSGQKSTCVTIEPIDVSIIGHILVLYSKMYIATETVLSSNLYFLKYRLRLCKIETICRIRHSISIGFLVIWMSLTNAVCLDANFLRWNTHKRSFVVKLDRKKKEWWDSIRSIHTFSIKKYHNIISNSFLV